MASSADEFQKIFNSVARRGEHMSSEMTEILKAITIYKRSLPVVRFKSARLIRKQEAIKNERVLAAKAAIEAMKNGKDKPKIEEIIAPVATKEDLRLLQQAKRAERYARRMRTKESVSPTTMELIKTSENEEQEKTPENEDRSGSSTSVSTKNSDNQEVETGNKMSTVDNGDLEFPEDFDDEVEINHPVSEEQQKRIDVSFCL